MKSKISIFIRLTSLLIALCVTFGMLASCDPVGTGGPNVDADGITLQGIYYNSENTALEIIFDGNKVFLDSGEDTIEFDYEIYDGKIVFTYGDTVITKNIEISDGRIVVSSNNFDALYFWEGTYYKNINDIRCVHCGVSGVAHSVCTVCGGYLCDGGDHDTICELCSYPLCIGDHVTLCEYCNENMCIGGHLLCTVCGTHLCIGDHVACRESELMYDGSAVTIRFYHTMGAKLRIVLDKYIDEFNEIYPNITIEATFVGGYDEVRDQIKTDLTSGCQPHIAYCYPEHVALYNLTGKVVPLDAFIESETVGYTDEQLADFIPGYYAEGAVFDAAGTMYTLPMSKSTEVLYYNKTFFDKNGLTVPTTWEEMEAVCARILEIDPYCIPLGYDSEANWFITMCAQYGSDYTSLDPYKHFVYNNETNISFVKMFREWYNKGYVTTKELYGGYTSDLFTSTDAEKCYMSIGSTGSATWYRPDATATGYLFEVGIAPIPQVDASNPQAISQGPSLCIFDHNNKQEVAASWLFVKFLTTNVEFQAGFSSVSGYMPVIRSAAELEVYRNFLANADGGDNITALAINTGLYMADSCFVSPAFNGSSFARDQVGALMRYCFVNGPASGQTVDEWLKKTFAESVSLCYQNA